MKLLHTRRSPQIWIISIIAVLFGLLTLKSGGLVLFVDGVARQQAGDYVPFVLWFNFLAGAAYVVAGIGLWGQHRWAAWLSTAIAACTLLVFALFGLHINEGGAYETRTVVAMSVRSTLWAVIAWLAYRELLRTKPPLEV